MNILDFVNSKDIRAYLKSVGYACNTLEASWLVYQSHNHTVEEKIAAWNWIINNMDDCEVPERINCSYKKSLHDTLRLFIDAISNKTIRFFEEGIDVAYSYKYYMLGDFDWTDGENLYSSVNNCWTCIETDIIEDEFDNLVEVRIMRNVIDKPEESMTVHFNNKRKIIEFCSLCLDDIERELDGFSFQGMWFNFPVPFEKGDVVIRFNENKYPDRYFTEGPFVLEDVTSWDIGRFDGSMGKKNIANRLRDVTDMNACGLFQDEDGRIYYEVMHNYLDLELYRGSFDGKRRLIKALSSFAKQKIGIDLLLTVYRRVVLDEFADDVMLNGWYTDESLELAGLRK